MGGELVHATLQRLSRKKGSGKDAPPQVTADGDPLPVQLNPSTLTLTRHNNVDRGGVTTGTQKAQQPSAERATLAFDLVFDTSEQGSDGRHVDVREWTALVRQFVEPSPDRPGEPPPAVQFVWGTLIFNGIIEQVTETLDFFARDGTPLHAKVGVSISEQNFAYEAMVLGPPSRNDGAAVAPGTRTGAAPGSSGSRDPRSVVQANAGESAQQVLSRVGQDPAAWRAAMRGLANPLSLAAGTPVQLGAEVALGGGVTFGLGTQFRATAERADPTSVAAALGMPRPPSLGPDTAGVGPGGTGGSSDAAPESGFVLSAVGGVAAAQRLVQEAAATSAAQAQLEGFEKPAPTRSARPPRPVTQPGQEPSRVSAVDPRVLTFGRGIPLQRRAGATAGGVGREPAPVLGSSAGPVGRARGGAATPPWEDGPAGGVRSCGEQRPGDAEVARLRWRPGGECR